jgi:Ca2+-binding RTX toxin-like protein
LSFNVASSASGNSVDVFWAGAKIGTVTPNGSAMQTASFVVEGLAGAASNKLSFNSIGAADGIGVSLDNVRLFAHQGVVETPDVFKFGLGSGQMYVTDFKIGFDQIFIKGDLVTSFDELMSEAAVYQDGRSTIIEFHNGRESIVLPQFDMNKLTPEMFTFEKPSRSGEMVGVAKYLAGSDRDDTIIAGAGSQTIDGGAGFDILTGGVGADTFVYNAKSGHDFITDFNGAEDRILISADFIGSFDQLTSVGAIYQDGKSTQIEMGDGQMITLYGVDAKTVTADWFVFA